MVSVTLAATFTPAALRNPAHRDLKSVTVSREVIVFFRYAELGQSVAFVATCGLAARIASTWAWSASCQFRASTEVAVQSGSAVVPVQQESTDLPSTWLGVR